MSDKSSKWLDFHDNKYLKVFGVVESEFETQNSKK